DQFLLDLALGDRRLHRRMLDRLAQSPMGAHWATVDAELFRKLAQPNLLTEPGPGGNAPLTEPDIPDRLIASWTRGFLHPPGQQNKHHLPVHDWLRVARDDEAHRDLLLDVLVTACHRNPAFLSRLYVTVRDWAHQPPEHRARQTLVSDCILRKINAAQAA